MFARHLLLLDIDGLRPDVFSTALENNLLPHIGRLLGGRQLSRGLQIPAVSNGNSITFCAQASLFTGCHPKDHGIQGNQYMNRFGTFDNRQPRRYGLDIGDILAVDDALRVFASGYAAEQLRTSTIYERAKQQGLSSVVAGNMYATGADHWIRPSFCRTGLMIKGKGPLKLTPQSCDRYVLDKLIDYIHKNGLPHITTMYFMGIDKVSHDGGPRAQQDYLVNHIDPLVGELVAAIEAQTAAADDLFVAVFSDHGQVDVPYEDDYALSIAWPGKGDLLELFVQNGRTLYRTPWQQLQQCDSFIGINGGCATVYVRRQGGSWAAEPSFGGDVLPLAQAFWDGHEWGTYGQKMQDSIAAVLVRNVERDGWDAPYKALLPDGRILSLEAWAAAQPYGLYIDPVNRLQNMVCPLASDILVLPNTVAGYYFGELHAGNHGGLTAAESYATLFYGWPGATEVQWHQARMLIEQAIYERCARENGRMPSIVDMLTGVEAAWGMSEHIHMPEKVHTFV